MKRFLIANIFGIGDVLFTTPLITSLKKSAAGAQVDYLCNVRTASVLKNDPDIDRVFVYEKDDYRKKWRISKAGCLRSLWDLFSDIRRSGYDAVFDLTLSREFGLLFMLAGIPVRTGLDYRKRGLFLTHKRTLSGFADKHVTEYYLELLKAVNVEAVDRKMRLYPSVDDKKWAEEYLTAAIPVPGKAVIIAPGGGASWGKSAFRKRWKAKGFAEVADSLAERSVNVILLGDASERKLCEEVASYMSTKPAMMENDLSLERSIGLISLSDLVLCNDGGILHMAAALGVRTVSIFGPVDDNVYGPYPASSRHKVISVRDLKCRPCYNHFKLPDCTGNYGCMEDINPREVAEACTILLDSE